MDKYVFHYHITKSNNTVEEGYISAENLWAAINSIQFKLDSCSRARSIEVELLGKLD